jgi:hypothetical protein
MPSELVQRLRNLHAHSGDPDTVAEAAKTLENLEGVCGDHIASIARLTAQHAAAMQHIDRLEALCRQQAVDIERLSVGRGTLTDEQARKVLAAVMEVQP